MSIDIQNESDKLHSMGLLNLLLCDKTTKANIIWGTDAYKERGVQYERDQEIKAALITGENSNVIISRVQKEQAHQAERIRQHAEVFTPLWICKKMNDETDNGWFYKDNPHPFNIQDKIVFLKSKKWSRYVDQKILEITCGEAPYLVSRYDVSTGRPIPINERTGILDRKLRIVGENTESEADWWNWVVRAYQSTYGYEFQGDNLLIARLNLLMAFEEATERRWGRAPTLKEYKKIINTIVWNIWQMDGISLTLPYAKAEPEEKELSLDFGAEFEEPAKEAQQPFCKIYNWRGNNSIKFKTLKEKGKRIMKFDFIIGNPPYQDETIGDNKGFAPPIYHKFMDESYKIADKVELVHPARFLFNAGSTPKTWNQERLNDKHFNIFWYNAKSAEVFPNTDIKGGVAISYRDAKKEIGPIETFTPFDELNNILKKVAHRDDFSGMDAITVTRTAYRLTDKMHKEHPEAISQLSKGHAYDMSTNIFDRLPQIFFEEKPNDGEQYIQILGRTGGKRTYRYLRADYVIDTVLNFKSYKVFLAKANGSGALGEVMSTPLIGAPLIGAPLIGATESFISIGCVDTELEAEALMKYIKSKFARVMLGILKTTQDITPEKWKYVPQQNFTSTSDIDWSKSISVIDQQLYAKYNLTEEEIQFIETHVKEMA